MFCLTAIKYMPFQANLGEIVATFSWALDLAVPRFLKHGHKVAYITMYISEKLGLDNERRKKLLFSSLLHDVGISSSEMKKEALQFDLGTKAEQHCLDGYALFKDFAPLSFTAPLILHHHSQWNKLALEARNNIGDEFLGNLIFLADRIDIFIKNDVFILQQKDKIVAKIRNYSGTFFSPQLVELFTEIAEEEALWLGLESGLGAETVINIAQSYQLFLTLAELKELAVILAKVIDRKSPFTLRHSQGVAAIASRLAEALGFSPEECRQMEIAGLLHDLGKLSIPDEILEKSSSLTPQEMLIIKQHTFYTYYMLGKIEAFSNIKEWAAFHHEKLNGKGYPFALNASNLSLGARIMAVSDVYQALSEERPYRKAMNWKSAFEIIDKMAAEGSLDRNVVGKLKEITRYPENI